MNNLSITKSEEFKGCLFRLPQSGKRVLWQITNSCNYSCSYCIFASHPGKIPNELSLQEIIRVLKELKVNGFTSIKFTGGEPFARKDLLDILEHASSCGFNFDLSTNASLINDKVAERIAKLNIEMVHVSIDGPNAEIHESVRGEDTFIKSINGILSLKNSGVTVRVGCVLFSKNENSIEEICMLCKELGVNEIIFSIMTPAGRIEGDTSLCITRPTTELDKEILSVAHKFNPILKVSSNFSSKRGENYCSNCPGGKRFLYIDNLGRIAPCTWMTQGNNNFFSSSTLREQNLDQLLLDPNMESFKELYTIGINNGNKGCPVHWSHL